MPQEKKAPRRYQCRQCPIWYVNRQSLWRHIQEIHKSANVLHCSRCAYHAGVVSTLQKHIQMCHPELLGRDAPPDFSTPALKKARYQSNSVESGVTGSPPAPKDTPVGPGNPPPETPATAPAVDETAQGPAVLSLSPTPLPPLVSPARSPRPADSPYGQRGKPRAMLQLMKAAEVSPPPSPASSLPSVKGQDFGSEMSLETSKSTPSSTRRRMAQVKEFTRVEVFLDGQMIKKEEHRTSYVKAIEVDEENRPTGK